MKVKKKKYEAPNIKARQLKPMSIICTSPNSAKENEEYELGNTENWW